MTRVIGIGRRKPQELLDYITEKVEKFATKNEGEKITANLAKMSQYLNEFTYEKNTLTSIVLLSRAFREHYVVITKFLKSEDVLRAENRFLKGTLKEQEMADLITNVELEIKDMEVLPISAFLELAKDFTVEAVQFDIYEHGINNKLDNSMRVVEGEELEKIATKNATFYS